MTKLEFISRQFAKAENKKYEHYVVTRIWHLLNNPIIKPVTQQFITRPSGRAMTDLYFPQLETHIEIDEKHHKKQIAADQLREADIIDATGHTILRVDVTKEFDEINRDIDKIVAIIRKKIQSSRDFKAWDLEAEQNPQTYIKRGYIDLKDDVAFKKSVDAANCFGCNYEGFQRGGAKHPNEPHTLIWFPKLYKNKDWNNQISVDEAVITQMSENPEKVKAQFKKTFDEELFTRIVFPRVKSPLGDVMYRFKGKYELDRNETNYERGFVWKRVATRVKTYFEG